MSMPEHTTRSFTQWSDKELWTAYARCCDERWWDTAEIYAGELKRRGVFDRTSDNKKPAETG